MSHDPLIGKFIGDYRILDLLGRGGMGTVYRAETRHGARPVAIKVIAPHIADKPRVAARFEAEARVVARIHHPNVIRIFDYGLLSDGTLFHVMELLDGFELDKLLKHRLTAEDLYPYVEQLCLGLQAAHDQGVVHRDLKPENIYITGQQPLSLKILDFGIAKLLDPGDWVDLTVTGMVLGTPMFIAPEQALGAKESIGPATDLYSLGVILYWMLCGGPPFETEALGLMLAMHIKDPPPPLLERQPDLPPAVAALVHRCLEKEPARRPASARALARAFREAVGGQLPVTGPHRRSRFTGPQRRQLPTGPQPQPTPAGGEHDTLVDDPAAGDTLVDDELPLVPDQVRAPPPAEPPTPPPILQPAPAASRRTMQLFFVGLGVGSLLLIVALLVLTFYLLSG
jgi:serine/threonine-protein kinase